MVRIIHLTRLIQLLTENYLHNFHHFCSFYFYSSIIDCVLKIIESLKTTSHLLNFIASLNFMKR